MDSLGISTQAPFGVDSFAQTSDFRLRLTLAAQIHLVNLRSTRLSGTGLHRASNEGASLCSRL